MPCMGASAQIIQEIDTRVVLMHDGSALVEQRWDVIIDEDDSGTEWYIPVNDMSRLGMDIKGLSVSENGTVFTSEGDGWVSKGRSRSDKANRCGILRYKDGSFDLCWGFGTTGQHQWDISYTITNLVQSLNDGNDAFIHQFVNDQLPSTPYHVRITVCAADSSITWHPTENVGGWTFGYECNNEFVGNSFVSDSDGRVRSAIVMMRFDKGMFSPSRSQNISFEQMQKKAFKGSDYKKKSGSGFSLGDLWDIFVEFGWLIISVFAIVGFWIYSTIRRRYIKATGKRWKQDIFGESRIDGWWREAPMGKDLDAAYALLKKGDKLAGDEKYDNGIVGAYFLRWIEEGVMKVTEETGENNKKRVNLLLTDIAAVRYMGLDPLKIKYLEYFIRTWNIDLSQLPVYLFGEHREDFFSAPTRYADFEVPFAWRGIKYTV